MFQLLIVQRYLARRSQGRQRIILIEGEPVGAINRVPAEFESRPPTCMSAAAPKRPDLTARELSRSAPASTPLRERGFIPVGTDVIGDWMTEINVTSPTGARGQRFGALTSPPCSGMQWKPNAPDEASRRTQGQKVLFRSRKLAATSLQPWRSAVAVPFAL